MYVDFSSLFVNIELYKASFDKYLPEFTSNFFGKRIFEKLFLPRVCMKTNFLNLRSFSVTINVFFYVLVTIHTLFYLVVFIYQQFYIMF